MGVPKFYRYISERYPSLSEVVKEYQIPDFDNLYLDMNGIIHMCSHPDDENPLFRITEEKIFQNIFHYIELLFRMIQPQKLFFMAVDGVAPRAKMNQQRGRRFRTAKDAEVREAKAIAKGEKIPSEERFDSNCITPGTVFMVHLHEQLKYFISNKISTDKLWKRCKIVLSGHETPGEGEHKIMDYIRYMKSQPNYDPNTKHCLYGLDADLIMLGLCTHEPHFCLLREEVKFGRKARSSIPEETTFHLLHLSLMREYLELEFIELKDKISFQFNIEKIIDDWVLMGFLVGNDFIPHLPNMHISNGSLAILYKVYIEVLPQLSGYINEAGKLNLKNFEKYMEALSKVDLDKFQETYEDLKYFESKTGRKVSEKERICYKQKISQEFKPQDLTDEPDTTNIREVKTPMDSQLADLIRSTENEFMDYLEDENSSPDDSDNENYSNLFEAEFKQYKTDYYMNKLDYEKVTSEVLQSQAECYVRAIQWNLHYYYNGVCSWSWFYPHHYAPYISDIKGFANLELKFDIGKPFLPFQQLLAVLPAASKTLLPKPYQHLMTFKESPIINYYPSDFQTDLNGKRQEWEAVVLLPFIVESKLLEAMKSCESQLTEEEIKRNSHGPMLIYEYTDESLGQYPAPNYFPDVKNNHAHVTLVTAEDIHVPEDKLVKGVCPGIKTDIYFPGFPTMKHLEFSSVLKKAKVRVFDSPSRGDNLILILKELEEEPSIENLAEKLLGKIILVGWPHLTEAKVISVSNNLFRYYKGIPGTEQKYNIEENKGHLFSAWNSSRKAISEHYMNRLGVDIGNTKILVYALPMTGRKYIYEPSGKIVLEKQWASEHSSFAFQTIVENLTVYDSYFATHKNIEDVFPIGCDCFLLGPPYYGSKGVVIDNSITKNNGRIEVSVSVLPEPDFSKAKSVEEHVRVNYMSKFIASQRLGITPLLLSRITGTLFVISGIRMEPVFENASKTNIGLNMKFNKHGEEIPGYTKKSNDSTWLYSLKAIKLVEDYMNFCPELFHALSGKEKDENFFEAELFQNETETGETLKKIVNWIKAQPYNSVQRKLCSSKLLEPDVITEIEKAVNLSLSINNGKNVTMQVKPQILYKSEIGLRSLPPDPKADYRMYDRIVSVRESHTVPFASKGTIIALHENNSSNEIKRNNDKMDWSYDVLFDHPFAGGLPLNCPDNRGYKMCATEMINLSYGARVAGNREIKTIQQSNNRQNWRLQPQFPNPQSPHSAFAIWNQQNKIENFSQPLPINNQYTSKNPDFLSKNQYKNVDQINPISLAQNSISNPNTSQSITALDNVNKYTPQLSEGSHLFMNQNAMCSAHELQAMWEKLNQIQINKSHTNININTSNSDISQNISENIEVLHNENNTQDSKIKYKPRISSETALQNLFPSFHNDRTKLNEELKMPDSGPSQIVNISHNEKNSLNSTEVLKMMLQIPDDKTSTPEETNRTSVSAHLTLPENSQKIPIQNFFQERKDVDNTSFYNQDSFCIKLLNMYQLYGLGIPRYNYLNSDDELIRAHVTLPDGRSIIGVPSTSREKASESAARIVLEEMKGRPILTVQQLPYLPSPPRQWYQKQNCNLSPRHNQNYPHPNPGTPNNYTKYDIKQNENEKKYIHSAMHQIQGKSPFVPLQAVKQQRSKTTSNSSFVNKSKSEKSNLEEPSKKLQTLPINKKNSVDTPTEKSIVPTKTNNSSKPLKKIKKSRIAANFSMAKKE